MDNAILFQIFTWVMALFSAIGVVLNIKKSRVCFFLWTFTNTAWMIVDFYKGIYAQSALFAVYVALAIIGIFAWRSVLRKDGEWRGSWKLLLQALDKKPFLNVDFDGVIAKTTVTGPTSKGIDGEPVVDPVTGMSSIDFLRESVKSFWVVICSTRCCRPEAKGMIAAWLTEHGLELGALKQIVITDQKAPGIIIDDRAWQFTGKFPNVDELQSFEPWHGKDIIETGAM